MRKASVPSAAGDRIRSFGLERSILTELLNHIHIDAPAEYELFRLNRVAGHEDYLCRYELLMPGLQVSHFFTVFFDDASSPDHLFLRDIQYYAHQH